MDLLWMILLVLVCAEAKNWSEVKVELGQNVSLNCSLVQNLHWYMEIDGQLRALIIRLFTEQSSSYFIYTPLKDKYWASGNRLLIRNITEEDCRLYFCAKRQNDSIIFEDAFSLVSDVPMNLSTNNSSAIHHHHHHQQQPHIWRMWQSKLVMFSSFTLNAILLLVVIGLVVPSVCLKRKNCNYKMNDPSPFTCDNPETLEIPQYEEIHLHTNRDSPPAAPPPECIYYKAQLPHSTLPQH